MIELLFIIESLLAFIVITLIASVVSACGYPFFKMLIAPFSGNRRSTLIFGYGTLAPLIGLWSALLLSFPQLAEIVIPSHCHGDVCGIHTPSITLYSLFGGLVAIASALVTLGFLVIPLLSIKHYRHQFTALNRLSTSLVSTDYQLIENSAVLAWSAGFWKPKVFISQGLKSLLTEDELAVVVAHEQAHVARRDNLNKFILLWTTKFWFFKVTNTIREDFECACEQACDFASNQKVGNKLLVLSTIKKVFAATQRGNTAEIKEQLFINKRIASLEDPSLAPHSLRYIFIVILFIMLLFCLVAFLTGAYHLFIESILLG